MRFGALRAEAVGVWGLQGRRVLGLGLIPLRGLKGSIGFGVWGLRVLGALGLRVSGF